MGIYDDLNKQYDRKKKTALSFSVIESSVEYNQDKPQAQ